MTGNLLLDIIQFIHVSIDAFFCLYIFLFNPIYDLYFVLFVLFQTIHWGFLRNECSITYLEKKLIDPNYVLGSNPTHLPHVSRYYNKQLFNVKTIIILSSLIYIWYRNRKHKYIKYIVPCAISLFIFFTFFYKHPIHNQHITPLFTE